MAFIYSNDNEITMNTTITEYGKQNLLRSSSLGVSKFALSDDGIDYRLLHNDSGSIDSIGIKVLPLTESPINYKIKYTLFPGKQNMLKSEIQVNIVPDDTKYNSDNMTLAQNISGSLVFTDITFATVYVYVLNPNIDDSKYTLTALLTNTLGILEIESDLPDEQAQYNGFNTNNPSKKLISFKNSFKVKQSKLNYIDQFTEIKISPSELLLVNDKDINIIVKKSIFRTGCDGNA